MLEKDSLRFDLTGHSTFIRLNMHLITWIYRYKCAIISDHHDHFPFQSTKEGHLRDRKFSETVYRINTYRCKIPQAHVYRDTAKRVKVKNPIPPTRRPTRRSTHHRHTTDALVDTLPTSVTNRIKCKLRALSSLFSGLRQCIHPPFE